MIYFSFDLLYSAMGFWKQACEKPVCLGKTQARVGWACLASPAV
jgi:hypothetical protein